MNINNLCMGCMKEKPAQGLKCPYCGYDDATDNNPQGMLPIWTILQGTYAVGKILGDGGFGITYTGFDLNLEKKVAIKEFFLYGSSARKEDGKTVAPLPGNETLFGEERDRFVEEARILASLDDKKGVVRVISYFRENNTAYIVMEYLEGISLRGYAENKGGKIESAELFTMLRPVVAALSGIHAKGVIHKDISPDNIIVDSNGSAKLIDFGAAYDRCSGREEQKVYKASFSPPEQMDYNGKVTTASDIYALCATIYFCLTGIKAPGADKRLVKDELIRPSDLGINIDPLIEEAIMTGMSLSPDERICNAADLYYFLYQYGQEPGAKPTEIRNKVRTASTQVIMNKLAAEKKRDRTRRNIFFAVLALIVLMLGFAVIKGIIWLGNRNTSAVITDYDAPSDEPEPAYEKEEVDAERLQKALYDLCGGERDANLEKAAEKIASVLSSKYLSTSQEWNTFITSTVAESLNEYSLTGSGWYVEPVHGTANASGIKKEADKSISEINNGIPGALDLDNSGKVGIGVGVHSDGTVFVVFLYSE